MTRKQLTFRILWGIIMLGICIKLFSNLIPNMIENPQDYLSNTNFALVILSVSSAILGFEIGSCVNSLIHGR